MAMWTGVFAFYWVVVGCKLLTLTRIAWLSDTCPRPCRQFQTKHQLPQMLDSPGHHYHHGTLPLSHLCAWEQNYAGSSRWQWLSLPCWGSLHPRNVGNEICPSADLCHVLPCCELTSAQNCISSVHVWGHHYPRMASTSSSCWGMPCLQECDTPAVQSNGQPCLHWEPTDGTFWTPLHCLPFLAGQRQWMTETNPPWPHIWIPTPNDKQIHNHEQCVWGGPDFLWRSLRNQNTCKRCTFSVAWKGGVRNFCGNPFSTRITWKGAHSVSHGRGGPDFLQRDPDATRNTWQLLYVHCHMEGGVWNFCSVLPTQLKLRTVNTNITQWSPAVTWCRFLAHTEVVLREKLPRRFCNCYVCPINCTHNPWKFVLFCKIIHTFFLMFRTKPLNILLQQRLHANVHQTLNTSVIAGPSDTKLLTE